MTKYLIAAAAAASLCLVSGAALAQQASPVGQWQCQQTYTEFGQGGQRASGWSQEFMLALYPNGAYEAQGTDAGAAGAAQFRSQGPWRFEQGLVIIQGGMMQRSDGAPGMFGLTAQLSPDARQLNLNYEQPSPTGQVANRSLAHCERRG